MDVTTCNSDANINIGPEDIIVSDGKINYGNKSKNPVDATRFFRSQNCKDSIVVYLCHFI